MGSGLAKLYAPALMVSVRNSLPWHFNLVFYFVEKCQSSAIVRILSYKWRTVNLCYNVNRV